MFLKLCRITSRHNQKLKVEGIFITSYEKNLKASFKLKTKLFEFNSSMMLNKSIPKDANMMTATFSKIPIGMLKPKSRASLAYKDLAEEIINRSFGIL